MKEPTIVGGLRLLLRLALRTDQYALVFSSCAAVAGAVLTAIFPWLFGSLVDASVEGGTESFLIFGALIGAAQACAIGLRSMSSMLSWNMFERMTVVIDQDLVSLATRLEFLEDVENEDFQDRLTLVRTNREHFQESMSTLLRVSAMTLQLLVTLLLLMTVSPLLLMMPVFAVAPMITGRWAEERAQRTLREVVRETRMSDAYALLALDAPMAGEVRVLRLGDTVRNRQRVAWTLAVRKQFRAELVGTVATLGGLLLFTAGFAGALLYVTWRSLTGDATLGQMVLVLSAGQGLHSQLGSLLGSTGPVFRIAETMRHLLWLRQYVDERGSVGTRLTSGRLTRGIDLRDVSFRYSGASGDALKHVNLTLPAGSTVAVVGENGAGKSTLVAVLCGLLKPTEGVIKVDETPLVSLRAESWRAELTAMFQDFVRYELFVREAIGLGAWRRMESNETVREALVAGGIADLEGELPKGLATPLGSAFLDGVELSGGQWQKVALARSMMRVGPTLRVLDEPIYSLDVESEHHTHQWLSSVGDASNSARGVTLIVSHRFSTVRVADLIVVMQEGRVIETGTHDHLIASRGAYARMYDTQARGYR